MERPQYGWDHVSIDPNMIPHDADDAQPHVEEDRLALRMGSSDIYRVSIGKAAGISCCGRFRTINQDRIFLDHVNDNYVFGVFDGHGALGENASTICATLATPFIASGLPLASSIQSMNNLLLNIAENEHRRDSSWAYDYGTTAAIVRISGLEMEYAWVGDSRIAVFEQNGRTHAWAWQWSSDDHNPVCNEIEANRLGQEGAFTVENNGIRIYPGRVMSVDVAIKERLTLNMSRALGHRILGKHGVSSIPDIMRRELSKTRSSCIICASDGIWDMVDEKDIAQLLKDHLSEGAENAAEAILLRCDQEWTSVHSGDNLSLVILVVNPR
uniref:PPM-type phosphatase domain-containing protein n=1 Tax=Spongospora subterranea TaxID=70186 RepID=A0A0H5RA48_9EUKA|eukprot:CRZ10963.1 hypothetical protein [Spongospora subterranea]